MVDDNSDKKLLEAGRVRTVGGKSVSKVTFSKDSKSLFCAYGSQIRRHNVSTGELVSLYDGHSDEVTDLSIIDKNHLQLISCSLDTNIYFWDVLDGSIIRKYKSNYPVYAVSVHKNHPDTIFIVQEHKKKNGKFWFGKASVTTENNGLNKVDSVLNFQKICRIANRPDSYSFSEKGDQVAVISRNHLQIWYFAKENLIKHYSKAPFTSIAFHPFDSCLATGHDNGKIIIWKNLQIDSKPICTKLHWHAHSVASLNFSNDGAYLYSGGEESVLVFWQVDTSHKQFKPRLGAPIAHICNNQDDTVIAVCHTDNVVNLVSAVDLSVVNVVQGLARANHVYTGLLADPLSKSLVLNSQDGKLQFYQPDTDSLAFTLEIVKQNYISKPKNEPLQMTAVEKISFSYDGNWLATVERRDDGKMTPENRLKFWKFNNESQRHVLNTCIDPPHEGQVVAVEFQPGSFDIRRAMSAAVDGKFKIWMLKKQPDIKEHREAWLCQSVGYLRDEPVGDATFSSDGSLLAVAYGQALTLWDPCINEQKKTLYTPYSHNIRQVKFGRKSCSHIALASTKHHLMAWDLLSCTVLWATKAEVISILPDPCSYVMAVFIKINDKEVHLYMFDPRSAIPIAIQTNVLRNSTFLAAGFQPNTRGLTVQNKNDDITMARLFYMNDKQVLYTIDGTETEEIFQARETVTESEESSEFHRVFGTSTDRATPKDVPVEATAFHNRETSNFIREMLSAPSHVLPPVTTLCSTFLHSLLISKEPGSEKRPQNDESEDEKTALMDTSQEIMTSDEESMVSHARNNRAVESPEEVQIAKDSYQDETVNDLFEVDFAWMSSFFKEMS
ncbi:WD repeat-containing protein 75-like [Dendronephthya gigantea]|uniref:WD repeat-containing protein 75-like n=1 Tax=Dendronephthya gigantea TaxID=151771 RepID=UPI0010697809|nr:WD repeat-containing protein 75-like [Dendronephthya gigantea]